MSSMSPDSRPMSRRDSSTRSSSSRRPRMLRAPATEPSITTSNASRNSLASSQSSRRATELLSRVAFTSGSPPDSMMRATSPLSTRTPMFDSLDRCSDLSSSPVSLDEMHSRPCTGRYFSFPSFDMYEEGQQDEEKDGDLKSP
ncbi:hypothetical protein B0H67DRAFT_192153 [Lasiosphaeris hirsuta]|uniref:Uncharacterized protein n=1 Tax=Lasiosphaeris hirsuta TaxID=260670 RepID=A0AA40DXW3_9PEZI|nr:hypothetical protein B0H67DRAFT_192153 [Lasiosphaeris hirsuta]